MPFVPLMKSSWTTFRNTRELYDLAVNRRGAAFKEALKNAGDAKVVSSTVKGRFTEVPTAVYFMGLSKPFDMHGVTKIVY